MMSASAHSRPANTEFARLELCPDQLAGLRWAFSCNPRWEDANSSVPITRSELHRVSHEYRIAFERFGSSVRPTALLPSRLSSDAGPADAGVPEMGLETATYLPLVLRLHPFHTEDETGRDVVQLDPCCVGADQAYAFFEAGNKESDALAQVRRELRAAWNGRGALAEAAGHLDQAGLLKPFDRNDPAIAGLDMKAPLLAISPEALRSEFGTRLADWMAHSVMAVELALVAEFSMGSGIHPKRSLAALAPSSDVDAILLSPSEQETSWLVEDDTIRF
ncbi:SapC family protein [Methylobacterium soli]|uniref:SapC family protein n=1 Tax=Methylobacterium soli TaxID=553447 RepID=A0A6L3SQ80_9HYPH|nr:SapC family protein [Methylobacterium soli]KAB1072897.1 SapC family protein [Methylobacterium soli]GJE42729.1 hypothetical protein AEGHOMDF_1902 [Methylobacterium soli]